MAAEHAVKLGLFETREAVKKKREDDYAVAVAAMMAAIERLPSGTSENTDEVALGASTPLLRVSPKVWAEETLKIVEGLKQENPRNIQLLTEVLVNTARYINHEQNKKENPNLENDPTILNAYPATREKVDKVYGRFSALSIALMGLPTTVLIGGIVAACALAVFFPAALIPLVCIAPFVILAGTFTSMIPGVKSDTIKHSWKGLDEDLKQTPSLAR